MSLITEIRQQVEKYTISARAVSNHTNPENPEAWRADNEYGRYATFLEGVANEVEMRYHQIEELDCQGEWCGKSPNRHDDGLCGVCKIQKQLFVDKLEG